MERAEEEEEKVFVCSLAYSTLMDTSTTDQDEKTSLEEASTSGASSGSGSESPGSPTPLVGERVAEVNHNGISFTTVRHSPLFRTKLPHLSAHSLALTAGARKPRYQSPYAPPGQYAQPKSYDKWSKQRKTTKWTRRRRLERPLLWLASAILILLLIAGIMIAVFWMSGSSSKASGPNKVVILNGTNTTQPGFNDSMPTTTTMTSTTSFQTTKLVTSSPATPTRTMATSSTSTTTTPTPKASTSTASTTTTKTATTTISSSPTSTTTRNIPSSSTTLPSSTSKATTAQVKTLSPIITANKNNNNTTTTYSTPPANNVPGFSILNSSSTTTHLPQGHTGLRNATERPP